MPQVRILSLRPNPPGAVLLGDYSLPILTHHLLELSFSKQRIARPIYEYVVAEKVEFCYSKLKTLTESRCHNESCTTISIGDKRG